MKQALRASFSPILNLFERGEGAYHYRPSQRKILLAVGSLFLFLCLVSLYFGIMAGGSGAFIPTLVFFLVSLFCLVVGGLGTDRAVARIWGSK
ncbi:MAG: hypothetical protein KDI28_10065 [Pseudomonadales bacterium]|nr:hypothetical protein [Pseudomonadales bacterium]